MEAMRLTLNEHHRKLRGVGDISDWLVSADVSGLFELGHLSSLLAGWQAGSVGLARQDSQALGRRHGSSAADTRGPFGLGQLSSFLAG